MGIDLLVLSAAMTYICATYQTWFYFMDDIMGCNFLTHLIIAGSIRREGLCLLCAVTYWTILNSALCIEKILKRESLYQY